MLKTKYKHVNNIKFKLYENDCSSIVHLIELICYQCHKNNRVK